MAMNKRIELLCPAGDLERLKTAVIFGADAVYCGLPDWSLRNPREITFNLKTLKEGIEFAHKRGVKVYVTFNVFPHEKHLGKAENDLKKIKDLEIDGIIVSDLGMFSLVKKHLPKTPIHVSTQANTLNSEAIRMWKKLGAKRIVLAREVTLKEIKDIKQKSSKIQGSTLGNSPRLNLGIPEIECFGHGAMCIAYSGRCLLSKYFTGREANLGDCTQSCRWRYKIKSCRERSRPFPTGKCYIEEETRSGNLVEVQEDKNGTYFLNSKEICSLDILDKFIKSGIDALKIEGRAKTPYYLATVTRAYRKAIDKYYELSSKKVSKKEYDNTINELYKELNLIQNRGYSHGFLLGKDKYEQEYNAAAFKPPVLFIGTILEIKNKKSKIKNMVSLRDDIYLVEVKNKFKVGEKVEIVTPDKIYKTKVLKIKNKNGKELDEILTPQERVWVSFDLKEKTPEGSIIRKKK